MDWRMILFVNTFRPAIGFIILAGLLLFWIVQHKFPFGNFLRKLLIEYIWLLILFPIFLSLGNAYLWSKNLLGSHLLPPYAPLNYVLHYSWQHYLFEPVVLILFAWLIYLGISWLNRKFQNNLFYKEEKYLAAIGILATGWPNCLVFLILVGFLGIISHLFLIICHPDHRLSLLYFWLPTALFVLLFGGIISKSLGISQFHI